MGGYNQSLATQPMVGGRPVSRSNTSTQLAYGLVQPLNPAPLAVDGIGVPPKPPVDVTRQESAARAAGLAAAARVRRVISRPFNAPTAAAPNDAQRRVHTVRRTATAQGY